MSTATRSLRIFTVWAALSAWCVGSSGEEPLRSGSPQADRRNVERLAVAVAGVKQIIAHRGSSVDRPENTLATTLRAIEAGATVVSCSPTMRRLIVRRTTQARSASQHWPRSVDLMPEAGLTSVMPQSGCRPWTRSWSFVGVRSTFSSISRKPDAPIRGNEGTVDGGDRRP